MRKKKKRRKKRGKNGDEEETAPMIRQREKEEEDALPKSRFSGGVVDRTGELFSDRRTSSCSSSMEGRNSGPSRWRAETTTTDYSSSGDYSSCSQSLTGSDWFSEKDNNKGGAGCDQATKNRRRLLALLDKRDEEKLKKNQNKIGRRLKRSLSLTFTSNASVAKAVTAAAASARPPGDRPPSCTELREVGSSTFLRIFLSNGTFASIRVDDIRLGSEIMAAIRRKIVYLGDTTGWGLFEYVNEELEGEIGGSDDVRAIVDDWPSGHGKVVFRSPETAMSCAPVLERRNSFRIRRPKKRKKRKKRRGTDRALLSIKGREWNIKNIKKQMGKSDGLIARRFMSWKRAYRCGVKLAFWRVKTNIETTDGDSKKWKWCVWNTQTGRLAFGNGKTPAFVCQNQLAKVSSSM